MPTTNPANRLARSGLALLLAVNIACSGAPAAPAQPPASAPSVSPQAERGAPARGEHPARLEEIATSATHSRDELIAALTSRKPAGRLSPDESRARLNQLYGLLEAAVRLNPRETFDIDAIVRQVGKDPSRLGDWIRDHIALVPYRGSLRGATGVLMDRVGNTLDRSLLLAALIKATVCPSAWPMRD